MKIIRVFLDSDVIVSNRLRTVNEGKVAELAESMRAIGLQQPISVWQEGQDGDMYLVAGRHRWEAAKRLKWDTIEAVVVDLNESDRRRWEIAENLHRAELTALERDQHVAEWIRLTDASAPIVTAVGTGAEKVRQSDALTKKKGRGKKSGVRQAARELGVSEPDARRAVKVDSLTPEAKAVAVEVGLDDNRTALLKAAEAPKDQQASVLTSIAVEKAKPTTSITFKTESHRAVKRSITSIVKSTVEDISAAAQNYENLAKQFGDLADLKGVSAADAREYVESIEGTISVLSKLRRALLKVSATSTEDPPLAGAHDGGARPSSDDARPTREAQ